MKLPYDRHHIDLGRPKLKQCKARKKAKYKGCGQWKMNNDKNFIEKSGICRECKRTVDRKRKNAKKDALLGVTADEIIKLPLPKRRSYNKRYRCDENNPTPTKLGAEV